MACSFPALAQFFPISGGNYTGCGGVFTDSGLATGSYGPNESYTITICPDGSSGTHARLLFAGVDVPYGDDLCFYDGPDTQAPSLGCAGDFLPGAPFIIQATAANTGGCLTVTFQSDDFKQGQGWTAALSCVAACQAFESSILLAVPEAEPSDTGWIDLCPGEILDLTGGVSFLQNNLFYPQADSLCTFSWDFGDGTIKQGPSASHAYLKPGGYLASLAIYDQYGCRTRNFTTRRIRVAPPPQVSITDLPGPLCPGDTLELRADTLAANGVQVSVMPVEGVFQLSRMRADSLPLPDGNGALYETSVFFSEFPPDRVLSDPSEILAICANMEHSWMRDLRIELTCPSGQKVVLVNQEESGEEVFLGQPFENDELLPVPIPGKGYTYCWDAGAPNGTWLDYANANTPQVLPEGTYDSFEPLSGLIGCPLNGEWILSVQDLWEIDNGYIFWWNIQFDETKLEKGETFRVPVTQLNWENRPHVLHTQGGFVEALADRSGETFLRVYHEDAFGCRADTFVTLPVLSPTDPQCLQCGLQVSPDTSLCVGDTLILEATSQGFPGGPVLFGAYPMAPVGYANHPPTTPYGAPISVSHLQPVQLFEAQKGIQSVCFDLKTNPANNIAVFLASPDGRQLELTTFNGGLGQNYTGTCFSPSATQSIKSGTAPFTGDFIPEGAWSDLDSAQTNGTWQLLVSDNFGVNRMGLLESWSITFETENQIDYIWSPSEKVDCPDCPSTRVETDTITVYQVSMTDQYGCTQTRQIQVKAEPGFPPPVLYCGASTATHLAVQWDAVPGAPGYEINIEGAGWSPVNGNLQHLIAGLSQGDTVHIQLRVLAPSSVCAPGVATLECVYLHCQLEAITQNTVPPSCHGASDGIAFISALKGKAPFQYRLDDKTNAPIGYFSGLEAGPHLVVVTDAMGCKDTTFFTLDQPDPILVGLSIDSASCSGSATGSITATASGGAGGISFEWQGQPSNSSPVLGPIPAGVYFLRIKDQNGCFVDTSATVFEPSPLSIAFAIDSIACAGGFDGAVAADITGGTEPYTLNWSTGSKNLKITDLPKGTYGLSVTDANGCTASATAMVEEASPYAIQTFAQAPSCPGGNNGKAWLAFDPTDPGITISWMNAVAQAGDTAIGLSAGSYEAYWEDVRGCQGTVIVFVPDATPWSLQITATNATCPESANGSAEVNLLVGGNPPFTFAWDDPQGQKASAAKALPPGNYQVTVTDIEGCSETRGATIGVEESLELKASSDPAPCPSSLAGSATVTASGGSAPYAFLWNDPAGSTDSILTNVPPGIYQVTVTSAKGCEAQASLSIEALEGPRIDQIKATPTRCADTQDGGLLVQASGGDGSYSYIWSDPLSQQVNPATDLASGDYEVTVTDGHGCSVVAQGSVGTPLPIELRIESQLPPSCNGIPDGSLLVYAYGGTGTLEILWNNGQSGSKLENIPAGIFYATVTDAQGCVATFDIALEEAETLVLDLLASDPTCPGRMDGSINATIAGGLPPYVLSLDGGPYGNIQAFERLGPGIYTVSMRDRLGCVRQDTVELLPAAPFSIDAGADVSIESGESIQLGATHDAPQTPDYFWTAPYSGTLDCETCPTPRASPLFTITYLLEALDYRGCLAQDEITVFVSNDRTVLVPTAFSPNGDGSNDRLLVHGAEGIRILEFRVYDRWGELLFSDRDFPINDTQRGWDGLFRQREMSPGVYIWNLEAEFPDGLRLPFQGQTTLIR